MPGSRQNAISKRLYGLIAACGARITVRAPIMSQLNKAREGTVEHAGMTGDYATISCFLIVQTAR
jgi:hypothetical protein